MFRYKINNYRSVKFTKNYIIVIFLIFFLVNCNKPNDSPSDVLSREQQRIEFLTSGDYEQLAEMLSATMSYTNSNAVIENKEQFLEILESGRLIYREIDHREVDIRLANPSTVIITGISDVLSTVEGDDVEVPLRFTIVYVKYDGQWLFEAWHSVRRPE